MQLLVSVKSAEEATAALAGGADIIDAKDPTKGALGPVSLDVFGEISARVAGLCPVSAALDDAVDEADAERAAWDYAAAGASFVKIGFGVLDDASRARQLIAAAVRGTRSRCGVVAVAYADADTGLSAETLTHVAARAGAMGILLDTADKSGPGLAQLMAAHTLRSWVATAHRAGLLVAVAGKLSAEDIGFACDSRADIVGVRGAACDGGRTSEVSSQRVRRLRLAASAEAEASARHQS